MIKEYGDTVRAEDVKGTEGRTGEMRVEGLSGERQAGSQRVHVLYSISSSNVESTTEGAPAIQQSRLLPVLYRGQYWVVTDSCSIDNRGRRTCHASEHYCVP